MSGVGALIDAVLVLEHGRTFTLTPLADGFRLEGAVDGQSGWFRYWPLEPAAGGIHTTDANVVERVWVRQCRPGHVESHHLSLEREAWLEPDEDQAPVEALESAHGNAWLARSPDDSLASLTVEDVAAGQAIEVPGDVPEADELNLWQRWPAAVRATCWRASGRTVAAVRFGEGQPERWARLGADSVWVGSSRDGELRMLVLGDVEEPPERLNRPGFLPRSWGDAPRRRHPRDCRVDPLRDLWARRRRRGPGVSVPDPASRRRLRSPTATSSPASPRSPSSRRVAAPASGTLGSAVAHGRHDGRDRVPRLSARRGGAGGRARPDAPRRAPASAVRRFGPAAERGRLRRVGARPCRGSPRSARRPARRHRPQRRRACDRVGLHRPRRRDVGDRDRYERLLWVHTMLRWISGWSGGAATLGEDGSVTMCISLRHGVPEPGGGEASMSPDPTPIEVPGSELPPDSVLIRRGLGHEVAFRIVEERDGWRIDTDLLRILIGRLGTLEEVVRPLSEQVG